MSVICGVDLKASEAIFVVLKSTDSGVEFIDIEPRKIKLANDESSDQVKSFYDSIVNFVKVNHIDTLVIKKRNKRGAMAGGAISFKIEALIQLNGVADVVFETGQAIAAANKKEPFELPKEMKKYQENAFFTASLFFRKI